MFVPIVGMRFHPPAEAIVKALPTGFEVIVVPEPSNPYDDKALRVLVDLRRLSSEFDARLDAELERFGMTSEVCELEGLFMLGYIAKPRPEKGIPLGNTDVWAKWLEELISNRGLRFPLAFDPEGRPIADAGELLGLAEWEGLPVLTAAGVSASTSQ